MFVCLQDPPATKQQTTTETLSLPLMLFIGLFIRDTHTGSGVCVCVSLPRDGYLCMRDCVCTHLLMSMFTTSVNVFLCLCAQLEGLMKTSK